MIFVTVGTHEQPFNRLIQAIDKLKQMNAITDDVFIQMGYSDYVPQFCDYKPFLSFDEMSHYMETADTVICHGGPATFMNAVFLGKHLIVVPRLKRFNEHVNDHQLEFLEAISETYHLVYTEDVNQIGALLTNKQSVAQGVSNNEAFCIQLSQAIDELVNKK